MYTMLFSLDTLSSLSSFAARVRYAQNYFERIGSGSGRIVFAVDEQNVLKVAKNAKGVAQNQVEVDYGMRDMYGDVIAEWRNFSVGTDGENSGYWVVSERAQRIGKKRFLQLTGADFDNFCCYITRELANAGSPWQKVAVDDPTVKDNTFAGQFLSFCKDFDLPAADFCRINSFGEVVRDGVPRVVAIDVGLTRQVYEEYYQPKRPAYRF